MGNAKPNTVPLNGRWMLIFKIHLAAIGPVFVGLMSLATWNFKTIGELKDQSIQAQAKMDSLRSSFDIIVRDGSPITRERLSVIESHLGIDRPKYRDKP